MRQQYKDKDDDTRPCTSNNNNAFEGTSQSTLQQPGQGLQNNLNGLLNHQPISPLIQTTLSQQHVAAVAAAAQQFLQHPQNPSINAIQRNQQINAAHLLSAASKCQINGIHSNNFDSRG